MKFKELRKNIYCPCKVIHEDKTSSFINTYKSTNFDDKQVVGIRSRYNLGFSYIEVLVK